MQPYGNNIIVKPFPPDAISEGGIIVPDSVKQVSNRVEIVAVGEGTETNPMKLKVGMVGYRVKSWGMELIIDDELYFLMDAGAIIAVE